MKNQFKAFLLVSLFAVFNITPVEQRKNLPVIDQVLETFGLKCVSAECLEQLAAMSYSFAGARLLYNLSPHATEQDIRDAQDLYYEKVPRDLQVGCGLQLRPIDQIVAVNVSVYEKCLQKEFLTWQVQKGMLEDDSSSYDEKTGRYRNLKDTEEALRVLRIKTAYMENLKKTYEAYVSKQK